jgi:hypothetical protein
MRSNSGKDESRNNLRDPTVRDRAAGGGVNKSRRGAKAPADHREGQQDRSPKAH